MIGDPKPEPLDGAIVTAVAHEGLSITTPDGRPARLAIIDADGNIVAAGEPVARSAWAAAIGAYRNFLRGAGHLRVHTTPPGVSG